MAIQRITPCLWFDHQAEEAARFYTSIFPNSKVKTTSYYSEGAPMPKGTVLTVVFDLDGQEFLALNAGPQFKFTEAVSFMVICDTQAEIDDYWKKLTAGGQESVCGWLKDKYGLSWQVTPKAIMRMHEAGDQKKTDRMMQALMQMKKLDLAKLEAAYNAA